MENYYRLLMQPFTPSLIQRDGQSSVALSRVPRRLKELAEPFDMGLPSFMKHLRILEKDGLISSQKVGRVRTCWVNTERLAAAESWLSEQRELWQARTDRLAEYVETQMSRSVEDAG